MRIELVKDTPVLSKRHRGKLDDRFHNSGYGSQNLSQLTCLDQHLRFDEPIAIWWAQRYPDIVIPLSSIGKLSPTLAEKRVELASPDFERTAASSPNEGNLAALCSAFPSAKDPTLTRRPCLLRTLYGS